MIHIISFTAKGEALSLGIREALQGAAGKEGPDIFLYGKRKGEKAVGVVCVKEPLEQWCGRIFSEAEVLIFIGATGIAVRTVAPFLQSKATDPAVLVIDELGQHVISLLSGHLGGGNAWARRLAELLGADPVITTASDVNGVLALDVWAKERGLHISDLQKAKDLAACLVAGERLSFFCAGVQKGTLPEAFFAAEDAAHSQVAVSVRRCSRIGLHLVPKGVILGIGCKRGKSKEEIFAVVSSILKKEGIFLESVAAVASIDKKADEAGLLLFAEAHNVPYVTYSANEL